MSHKVLIIEDDAALLRGLQDNFKDRGYLVVGARDGEAGLDAAMKDPPDLILLDIMLPKLGGFDVLKTLRSDELLCSTSVLILTARGQQYDRKAAMDLRADGFITKPFANDEVVAAVRNMLDGGARLAMHA